ncbi:MAG: hypothetical protein AMXMBFR58_15910 [Phycisphaerae bacterium]
MPLTERDRIATALARGLAGYLQHQLALNAGDNLSELHLQFVDAQILERALPSKPVYVNKTPEQWKDSRGGQSDKTLDLASGNQRAWRYIAEMKYIPVAKTVLTTVREAVVQDAARLATVPLAVTDAETNTGRFLVLCCRAQMRQRLLGRYDTGMTGLLRGLLSVEKQTPDGKADRATLQTEFKAWQDRTPKGWKLSGRAGLKASLILIEEFRDGTTGSGEVGIWHCG